MKTTDAQRAGHGGSQAAVPSGSRGILPLSFSLIAAFTALLLAACTPSLPRKEAVKLEVRADGLTYALGASEPYTGKFVRLNADGRIHEEQDYLAGKKHGVWKLYYETGKLKRQLDFVHDEIVREREWHPNGQRCGDEAMRNGVAFGHSTFWFPDGRIRKQAFVLDNLQVHGHFLEFNEDGSVKADAIYDNGIYVSGKRGMVPEPWLKLRSPDAIPVQTQTGAPKQEAPIAGN